MGIKGDVLIVLISEHGPLGVHYATVFTFCVWLNLYANFISQNEESKSVPVVG